MNRSGRPTQTDGPLGLLGEVCSAKGLDEIRELPLGHLAQLARVLAKEQLGGAVASLKRLVVEQEQVAAGGLRPPRNQVAEVEGAGAIDVQVLTSAVKLGAEPIPKLARVQKGTK